MFLLEIVLVVAALIAAYMSAVSGQPVYVFLLPVVAALSALTAMFWNKIYVRVTKEIPDYESPGTRVYRRVERDISRTGLVVGPVKTGICWLIANMFLYWYLLYDWQSLTGNYYYYASGLCFHLLIAVFIAYVLVVRKSETLRSLGFRIGKMKEGIFYTCLAFVPSALVVARVYVTGGHIGLAYLGTPFRAASLLFFYAIFGPLTEEVIFRGYVQQHFQKTMGRVSALFWASLIFTTVHIPKIFLATSYLNSSLGTPWLSIAPIALSAELSVMPIYVLRYIGIFFLVGLFFGLAYRESDSVIYPMTSHGLYNLLTTIIIVGT